MSLRQRLKVRKVKGLCFKCDKKFTPAHRCKKRLQVLLCLDEEDEMEATSVEEELRFDANPTKVELSIQAMVGLDTSKTIKVQGTIKGKSVIVLVDSGATHNFIYHRYCMRQWSVQGCGPYYL